jgi:hypothetical protein
MCTYLNLGSPPWRRKTYPRMIRESVYVCRLVSELEANIHRTDYREFINKHFDPASILRRYKNNKDELCIDRVVALNIAELLRRIKCLLDVLKKIDESDRNLYVSDTVNNIMINFNSTIKTHVDSDMYVYDMLYELNELHDKLKRTIFNITSDNY